MPYYSPNEAVVDAHNIPHLIYSSGSLSSGPSEFSTGKNASSSLNLLSPTGYFAAIVPFPALVTMVGLFSLILLQFCVFLRCFKCCSWLKSEPSEAQITIDPLFLFRKKRLLKCLYVLFLFVVVLAAHSLWFSNKDLDDAIASMGASVDSLKTIFVRMRDAGNQMQSDFDDIIALVDSTKGASCYSDSSVQKTASIVGSGAAHGISALASPVIPLLAQGSASVVTNGQTVKLYLVGALYGLSMALVLGLAIPMQLRRKCILKGFMIFTGVLLFALTIISGIEMVVIMLLGDFCMDPIKSLNDLTTSNSVKNIFTYYGKCDGSASNPFDTDVQSVTSSLEKIGLTIGQSNAAGCNEDIYTKVEAKKNDALKVQLPSVTDQVTKCDALHQVIDQFLLSGVCGTGTQGVFKLFVSQYIIQLGLFLVLVVGCVLYQYFDIWFMDQDGSDPTMRITSLAASSKRGFHDDKYDEDDSDDEEEGKSGFGGNKNKTKSASKWGSGRGDGIEMHNNPALVGAKPADAFSHHTPSFGRAVATHHRDNPIKAAPASAAKPLGYNAGALVRGGIGGSGGKNAAAAVIDSEHFEVKVEPRPSKQPRNFAPSPPLPSTIKHHTIGKTSQSREEPPPIPGGVKKGHKHGATTEESRHHHHHSVHDETSGHEHHHRRSRNDEPRHQHHHRSSHDESSSGHHHSGHRHSDHRHRDSHDHGDRHHRHHDDP